MKTTYFPGFPDSGPWWESPRGRGRAPSPHNLDLGHDGTEQGSPWSPPGEVFVEHLGETTH